MFIGFNEFYALLVGTGGVVKGEGVFRPAG